MDIQMDPRKCIFGIWFVSGFKHKRVFKLLLYNYFKLFSDMSHFHSANCYLYIYIYFICFYFN